MSENNPPGKKRWEWLKLKPKRSDPHLPGERPTSDTSSPPPSSNESRGRPQKLARKLFGKAIKPPDPSVRQSSNPEPTGASSSADIQPVPVQSVEDPSPLIASTPEPNIEPSSDPGIAKAEQPDQKFVHERITAATNVFADIGHVPAIAQNSSSAANNLQSVSDKLDTFSALLGPLKVFNSIANGIADVHPYAKVALGIFTCASKMILDQADRDDAVSLLLSKISEIYTFITQEEELPKLKSMLAVYGKIARQTLECVDFIVHYSEVTSFWRRVSKHVVNETDAAIKSYSEALDKLMQQFRDQITVDTIVTVHHIAEDLDLSGMEYVRAAGRNTSKNCLPDTRKDILADIKSWVCNAGIDVPRVLWLSGTAGKGKSAIAHTIANWSHEQGGLGACFCFDRTRGDRLHEKIFTTIARDLADCNPTMRRALAHAVHDNNELRHTADIPRQWQELIVGPTCMTPKEIAPPILIIIEALDESGDPKSREQILRLLAGDPNTSSPPLSPLPSNFRIIVTSRPLQDIRDALDTSHVRHVSMDDDIPAASAKHDIQVYISDRLKAMCQIFNDAHFEALALKSDGLFEWARLASEYIKSTNIVGRGPMRRYRDISETSAKGTHLLDEMYQRILGDIMPKHTHEESIPIFQSVMGQILASSEPLPITALNAMRQYFPCEDDQYDVNLLIGHLGSLVFGTSDSHTPIRPLHASFYDFLTDKSRSQDFFVDTSLVQGDLAFSSLRVMDSERGLRFNICSLESSYLPNSAVPDLEKRVKESISAELSYSCRFWGTHVAATSFEATLAKEIEAFFDGERLLWWLEALALMKSLGGSVDSLLSIVGWVAGDAEYTHIGDTARDTLRFVRTFAPTILRSTPHLYLSALPFAPTESRIFRQFATKYPFTPHIVAGHVVNWPQMEKILHANDKVRSVAMSPDGKRIACGLYDGTIQVWDTETGEASCSPLQGHTNYVASVVFSPDGHRIVSGSYDKTVRVWDAATGKALGAPLQGHTKSVASVAISPNGNHIVSGSWDETIRVWDIGTGKALGPPLEGHTDYVTSVSISPNGNHIVSGSDDETIRVWDMETGKALGVRYTGGVQSVAISPDGKHIVSGSHDKTIRVWDMETGEAFGAPLQGHTSSVTSVTISSDGHHIVSGSSDQTIRVWDLKTGEALGSPLQGHTSFVLSVAISPDGNRIVSGSSDDTIRVWDADIITGKALVAALQSHSNSVYSVAISPDGKRIVSGSADKTVRVWDMGTGKALTAPLEGHSNEVRSVAISRDGHHIISGSFDKTVRMWDLGTGEALSAPLLGHTGTINSVTISLDGRRIVSGSDDNTVRVWDVEAGETLGYPLKGHFDWVRSVAISSDGNSIVSGSDDNTIQVWDMGTGKASSACLRGHTDYVLSIAISLDGRRIVSGSDDKTIRVWDMGTGEPLGAALQGHTASVNSVAISSDGNHIVSGSSDRTIQVWDMATGEAVGAPFRGHTETVLSVAISPDGKHIVSGSYDKTIRVWDVEFLNHHHPSTPAICFSPNPTHALHSASSFLQDSSTPASVAANEEGWIVGPEGRLLLWIPLNFHPVMYAPGNTVVIANNPLQLDLSCLAHGTSWHECRTQGAASSS